MQKLLGLQRLTLYLEGDGDTHEQRVNSEILRLLKALEPSALVSTSPAGTFIKHPRVSNHSAMLSMLEQIDPARPVIFE